MPTKKSEAPADPTAGLVAAAYRVLHTRAFRDVAGNPSDPESRALQVLLDAVCSAEKSPARFVVHCQACPAVPHGGLKHGTGSTLGALRAPCNVPGCICPGYSPNHK